MTALLILANDQVRARAIEWIRKAPDKTRVRFDEPKRTLAQNDRFQAMLTELTRLLPVHNSVKMDSLKWKAVLMQALGAEMLMLPTLDGDGWFPMGHRSSKLSVSEMGALMDLMEAFAAQKGMSLNVST